MIQDMLLTSDLMFIPELLIPMFSDIYHFKTEAHDLTFTTTILHTFVTLIEIR